MKKLTIFLCAVMTLTLNFIMSSASAQLVTALSDVSLANGDAKTIDIVRPVGGNTVSLTIAAPNPSGSSNYLWTITTADVGITSSLSGSENRKNNLVFNNNTAVTSGSSVTYIISVTRAASSFSATVTVNLHPSNMWAAYNTDDEVHAFAIGGGVVGAGPTKVFGTGTNFAALGRSEYPLPDGGWHYWIPNNNPNTGNFTLYARKGDGSSTNTSVYSGDLNGSSNTNSMGFVRLGLSKNKSDGSADAWILAMESSTGKLYLAKAVVNGSTAATLTIVDNDVQLQNPDGTTITDHSVFQNGDLCLDGNGTIYALANDGSGKTEVYIGNPGTTGNGSTVLKKKWNLLTSSGADFSGSVNGICFDVNGDAYFSASDGIYYMDHTTIATAATSSTTSTIKVVNVYSGTGYTDLATNNWPTSTSLPVVFSSMEANVGSNQAVKVEWSTSHETNNDYFGIEVSKDGVNFKEVAKVASQITADNVSYGTLNYSYDINPDATYFGLTLIALLIIAGFVMRKLNLTGRIALLSTLLICSILFVACNKSDITTSETTNSSSLFVRVAQHNVDKTAPVLYTKTIKVR